MNKPSRHPSLKSLILDSLRHQAKEAKTLGEYINVTKQIVSIDSNIARGMYSKHCSKQHYKTFLRLNDRKSMQSVSDFVKAGYSYSHFWEFNRFPECVRWCNEQYGPYGYVSIVNYWIFENENDHLLFQLRWL